jgi:hypothetical protein
MSGLDSTNLAILAGISPSKQISVEEVLPYFEKSLIETGIELPDAQNAGIAYARRQCTLIINDEIPLRETVSRLASFFLTEDYPPPHPLAMWYWLNEEIDLFDYLPSLSWYWERWTAGCTDLTFDSVDECIRKHVEEFLKRT